LAQHYSSVLVDSRNRLNQDATGIKWLLSKNRSKTNKKNQHIKTQIILQILKKMTIYNILISYINFV